MNVLIPVVMVLFMLVGLIVWNRKRVAGKMLCFFVREDKSLVQKLCPLRDAWVIWGDRAYDIYPDFVRVTRFPSGWPLILQEVVPCALYDEEAAIPLDWITIGNREPRSMEIKAALDENWIRKLVEESAREGRVMRFDWRKYLPIILVIAGVVGLVFVLMM